MNLRALQSPYFCWSTNVAGMASGLNTQLHTNIPHAFAYNCIKNSACLVGFIVSVIRRISSLARMVRTSAFEMARKLAELGPGAEVAFAHKTQNYYRRKYIRAYYPPCYCASSILKALMFAYLPGWLVGRGFDVLQVENLRSCFVAGFNAFCTDCSLPWKSHPPNQPGWLRLLHIQFQR